MFKAGWKATLILGIVLPVAGLADDNEIPVKADHQQQLLTLSTEELITQSAYASRWQLHDPVNDTVYSMNWQQQMADFDFQDESALARMSRLRALSLLTIAEFGPTRLFFGVNHDGLVGLHFNPLPQGDDKRDLELIRMPYLQDEVTDSDVENLRADSN